MQHFGAFWIRELHVSEKLSRLLSSKARGHLHRPNGDVACKAGWRAVALSRLLVCSHSVLQQTASCPANGEVPRIAGRLHFEVCPGTTAIDLGCATSGSNPCEERQSAADPHRGEELRVLITARARLHRQPFLSTTHKGFTPE